MSGLDLIALWIGRGVMVVGALAATTISGWLIIESLWKLAQTFPFAARVIRLGLKGEGERQKALQKEIAG